MDALSISLQETGQLGYNCYSDTYFAGHIRLLGGVFLKGSVQARNDRIIRGIRDYLLIILGCIITAAGINIFLVPYRIAAGGVTGIATVIYYLIGGKLQVGTIMLILNIPLFIFGFKYIGGKFIARTLFSTAFLSLAIDVLEPFTRNITDYFKIDGVSNPDYLLYSVFGGFFMGLGLGMVLRSGATTGGTDLAARIIHHFVPAVSVGKILLIIDVAVVLFAAVSFKSFLLALYAIVTVYISTRVIDIILEGLNFAKAAYIISDYSDQIAEGILKDLDRGVTALKGTGMYTKKDKQVLFCIIQSRQLPALKALVRSIDPNAFLILTDVTEVLGEGFKTYEQA